MRGVVQCEKAVLRARAFARSAEGRRGERTGGGRDRCGHGRNAVRAERGRH